MSNLSIVTMNASDIDFMLSNFEQFSDSEVKLSAKRKVFLDKERSRNNTHYRLDGISDLRNSQLQANGLDRANRAYSQGLSSSLGLGGLLGQSSQQFNRYF